METIATSPVQTRRLEDTMPAEDPAAILRLRGWGGQTLVQEMVHLFERLALERVRAMHAAAALSDARALEAAAHALGSSCGQVGAVRMQRLCMHIERLAGEEGVAAVPPLLRELEEAYERVVPWLASQSSLQARVA